MNKPSKSAWRRGAIEIAIAASLLVGSGVWSARFWNAWTASGGQAVFYQSYFEPAVMVACGKGYVISQGPRDFAGDDWPLGALPLEMLVEILGGGQADYRATMTEIVPLMFKDELSAHDLAWMLDETCKIGANAGCCVIFNQTMQCL